MLKPQEDDLFRTSTMTFGEHLEELRRRLFRAIFWLVAGLIVGLFIGKWVVHVIESPLTKALTEYYAAKARAALVEKVGDKVPPEDLALMEEGFVAEQVYIEPSRLLDALGRGSAAAVQAIPRLPVYRLASADILRPKELAEALKSAGADMAATTPAQRIWDKLQPDERAIVTDVAAIQGGSASPNQVAHLTDALNRLIEDKDFYSESYFADITKSDELDKLVADRAKLPADQLRRMNWLLLSDAFPELLAERNAYLAQLTLWRRGADDERTHPKAMSATEAFTIYMKAALLSGLILFSPMIFREIWMFVAAGLYPHERRYVYIFLPFSVVLFVSGALMAFFAAFPPVLHFLFSFNDWLGIGTDMRINEWLSFVLFLPLAFGIGFQLPLVMLFLNRIGVVTVEGYWRSWRMAVLVIVVLAPILNPSPDPYSMLLMAVPMILLYFGGIQLCKYASRRKPAGIGSE